MAARIDFSQNARVYDRRHGAFLTETEVDRLLHAAPLSAAAHILEIGTGTGRVAVPLATRVRRIVALEPSPGMVEQLRAKNAASNLVVAIGEGGKLPLASETFDAVVVARLLYLTPDWTQLLSEATRVLKAGALLLHEWGNGDLDEAWVQVREELRRLLQDAGFASSFHPGARSDGEVNAHLNRLGFSHVADVGLGAGPMQTLREFVNRIEQGEVSYLWNVPESVQRVCLPLLSKWAEQAFDMDQPVPVPQTVRWQIFKKSM